MGFKLLVINPGSTSTKIAVYEDEAPIFKKSVNHPVEDLKPFARIFDQFDYRFGLIRSALEEAGISLSDLSAAVGRGGLLKPMPSGTYRVDERMMRDLREAPRGEHASNLGGALALRFAREAGPEVPAFIVDPVSVDEFEPVARISGSPEIERPSFLHALNHKAVARRVAAGMGRRYEEVNLVVAHMGSGVSVGAHKRGRVVDVNEARQEGPFSAERAGGVPAMLLVDLCYSGKYTHQQMRDNLARNWGLGGYLGTKDLREVEARIAGGDRFAELILDALAYQVAQEIGAKAAVLKGQVDRIVLTGGMAHSENLVGRIRERVAFLAPIEVVPGEEEMEALAQGALRVLRGEEEPKAY
jgi:butyrate kinase